VLMLTPATAAAPTVARPLPHPYRTPIGWTARVDWPLLAVDAIPALLAPLVDLPLQPVLVPAALGDGSVVYVWGAGRAPVPVGALYVGEAGCGRTRLSNELAWTGPEWAHAHGVAATRTGAYPYAARPRLRPVRGSQLRRWLTADGVDAVAARADRMPDRRLVEAILLRAAAHLGAPAPVNCAGAALTSSSDLDNAGWALAQEARRNCLPVVTHQPLRLLTAQGLQAAMALLDMRLQLRPLASTQPGAAGKGSVVLYVDGVDGSRAPANQPVLAAYATSEPAALDRRLRAADTAFARLVRARGAQTLVALPTSGRSLTSRTQVAALLQPAREAAALHWLRTTAPDYAVVQLAGRVGVHAGTSSPVALPTTAWAPVAARRAADDAAWAAVELAVTRAGQPG
jgi:hypothetical protein